ncbi:MAG: arginine--tRNA ligase [Candidatus Nomurabacteria bacterium]
MTLLEQIKKEIANICCSLNYISSSELEGEGFEQFKFDVSFIDEVNNKFGDVSVNVALILVKKTGKNLKEITDEILKEINLNIEEGKEFSKIIKEVNVAPNGFINIFLKSDLTSSEVKRVSDLKIIETKFTNKKVLVEHSSPNLFKPFNIGLFMNNSIGESLVRMMKATNADLKTISFPSDISLGIAKAIYILKNKKDLSFEDENIIKILGDSYVEGVRFYDENPDKQSEILKVAQNLFGKNRETEDYKLFEKSKEVNVNYFKNIVGDLGSTFDNLIYESEAGIRGEAIVKENMNLESEKEVFEVGEGGAIVYDTKRKKNNESDETIKSVFINSEGHPTYEAKDLGLLQLKYEYFPFDYNFFVTDHEQIPHFEVVLDAAKKINEDWKNISEKSIHVTHGRMTIKGEKMSTRLGNALLLEDIFEITESKAKEKLNTEKIKALSEEEKVDLLKKISLSALRISVLKSKPGLNIDFDPDTSLNFDGATGPYLLYTYARANSIIEKSGIEIDDSVNNLESVESLPLMKKIIQSEAITKKAIEEVAPQLIVKYLFELTQAFNTFYAKEKILDENNLEKTKHNLYLLKSFTKVLKFGMNIIGIKEVERM